MQAGQHGFVLGLSSLAGFLVALSAAAIALGQLFKLVLGLGSLPSKPLGFPSQRGHRSPLIFDLLGQLLRSRGLFIRRLTPVLNPYKKSLATLHQSARFTLQASSFPGDPVKFGHHRAPLIFSLTSLHIMAAAPLPQLLKGLTLALNPGPQGVQFPVYVEQTVPKKPTTAQGPLVLGNHIALGLAGLDLEGPHAGT